MFKSLFKRSNRETTREYPEERRGFNFNELTKLIQNSVAGRKIIILDCCYSGAAKVSKGHEDDAAKLGSAAIERQFSALEYGEGVCLMAAGQAYQEAYALEEKNHSLFTYYLLEGLRGNHGAIDVNGYGGTEECILSGKIAQLEIMKSFLHR